MVNPGNSLQELPILERKHKIIPVPVRGAQLWLSESRGCVQQEPASCSCSFRGFHFFLPFSGITPTVPQTFCLQLAAVSFKREISLGFEGVLSHKNEIHLKLALPRALYVERSLIVQQQLKPKLLILSWKSERRPLDAFAGTQEPTQTRHPQKGGKAP